MAAGRFGFRIFQRTSQRALQAMERISGVGFLQDISEFLLAIEGMSDGFRDRATQVQELLVGEQSAFLLIAGPSPEAARGGLEFLARMRGTGVPVEGVLMNRIRVWPDGEEIPAAMSEASIDSQDLQTLADALAPLAGETALAAARSAVDAAKRYASLVQLDRNSAGPLRDQTERNGQLYGRIPEFPRDVCDCDGLLRIGDALFRNTENVRSAD
jgi:anion-transporting  ArsA/GET3 family ATPase